MTAQRFLIAGLPRSRTTWLSVFTTTGRSMCYHDPLITMSDISELEDLYESEFYKFVGISDTGVGFFLDLVLPTLAPRALIVERDPDEVYRELIGLGVNTAREQIKMLHDRLLALKSHPLVMWVPYEALNIKRVMQRAFWHLMPGEPFDEVRYEQLTKINMQVNLSQALAEAQKHKRESARLYQRIFPVKDTGKIDAKNLH